MGTLSKIQQILTLSDQGYDKVTIAKLLQYKHPKSLVAYMKRHGYTYQGNRFLDTSSPDEKIQLSIAQEEHLDEAVHNLSYFTKLDQYLTVDLSSLYNDLRDILSPTESYILALLLLKDMVPSEKNPFKKIVEEQVAYIHSVKSFICRTFSKDKEALEQFFILNQIGYTQRLLKEAKSIKSYLQNDNILNHYFISLNTEELEGLRFKVSMSSAFTKGLDKGMSR